MVADNDGRPDPFGDVREWIDDLIDGRLGLEEMHQLERLVCERADVRRFYVRYLHLHGCLRQLSTSLESLCETFGDDALASDQDPFAESICVPAIQDMPSQTEDDQWQAERFTSHAPSRPAVGNPVWRLRLRSIVAAVAAVLALGCALFFLRGGDQSSPASLASPVAFLTDSIGAQWNGQAPGNGQELTVNAALELTEGLGRLRFGKSDLIVQGPARFTPIAANRIELSQGALWVRADSGPGFEVVTPGEVVRDLGTEFGVRVESLGQTSVHVFEGRVEVSPAKAKAEPTVLVTGDAAVFDGSGAQQAKTKADPQAFVRPPEYDDAALAAVAAELLQDPTLAARIAFTKVQGRVGIAADTDVTGIGAHVSLGHIDPDSTPQRLPKPVVGRLGRTAASFDPHIGETAKLVKEAARPLDFAREKTAGSFSVAAWVRALKVQDAQNGACIAMYGLNGREQYSLNIYRGVYRFLVRDARGELHEISSRVGPDEQWHHVVATFDPTGTMRLYVDGKLQATKSGPRDLLTVEGEFWFGSGPGSTPIVEYGLSGAIDELVIWRKALGEREVAALYRAGE
jgi:hypothetical protein